MIRRLLLATLLLLPAFAWAQTETPALPAATPTAADEASPATPAPPPGYERVSGAGAAQVPIKAAPLVVISYVVIWLLTLLYLFYLWRRQAGLRAEIDALQARLDALDAP